MGVPKSGKFCHKVRYLKNRLSALSFQRQLNIVSLILLNSIRLFFEKYIACFNVYNAFHPVYINDHIFFSINNFKCVSSNSRISNVSNVFGEHAPGLSKNLAPAPFELVPISNLNLTPWFLLLVQMI